MAHGVVTNSPHYTPTDKRQLLGALALRWVTEAPLPLLVEIVMQGKSEFVRRCRKTPCDIKFSNSEYGEVFDAIKRRSLERAKNADWANIRG